MSKMLSFGEYDRLDLEWYYEKVCRALDFGSKCGILISVTVRQQWQLITTHPNLGFWAKYHTDRRALWHHIREQHSCPLNVGRTKLHQPIAWHHKTHRILFQGHHGDAETGQTARKSIWVRDRDRRNGDSSKGFGQGHGNGTVERNVQSEWQ